ncbi:cellulose biosynthesis protein BcsQ [Stenotrophomonas acidaminiphila]
MSTTLSLQGVRGGVGVTTMTAALGHALHAQGERVLLVEGNPDHLLGLHLGLPAAEARGWARAWLDGDDWRDAAFEARPGLALLPYGLASDAEVAAVEERLRQSPRFWAERLPLLAAQFDWILFDLPQRLDAHVATVNQHAACALPLRLATVDPGCHVLLQRRAGDARRVLCNRYDPTLAVQRDLMQLWIDGGPPLVPQPLHEDASVSAALARKLPLDVDADGSQAAADVASLAVWCLAERGRLRARQGRAP